MSPSVLFVVHAGEGVGLGHLTRSLVAAQSLVLRLGAHVNFVAVGQNIDVKLAREFKVHFSVTQGQLGCVLDRLTKKNHYAAICLDLLNVELEDCLNSVLENVRKAGCQIVVIDALQGFERLIDLLYVPSFMPPAELGEKLFQGRLAFGWNSYLLNVAAERQTSDEQGPVLVLTGGSDATLLGRDWPLILAESLPAGTVIDWVTGPFSEPPKFPTSSDVNFIEHFAPAGLGVLMRKASIAVTVYGVSFFELIALGVPTVVFSPYGEKDSRELQEIARLGIAVVARDASDAAAKAVMLLRDSGRRAGLSKNAKNQMKNHNGEYFSREFKLLLDQQAANKI